MTFWSVRNDRKLLRPRHHAKRTGSTPPLQTHQRHPTRRNAEATIIPKREREQIPDSVVKPEGEEMSVKRYDIGTFGGMSMELSSDGAYVRHGDYAALEARCAALASENAGLKAVCEDRRTFIMNGVQLGYIQVPTVETDPALETIRVAVSPQEPTTETDAFLAEVRAQGVEMFAEHKRERQQALRSRSMRMSEEAAGMAADAENFAAEIRKGVQS